MWTLIVTGIRFGAPPAWSHKSLSPPLIIPDFETEQLCEAAAHALSQPLARAMNLDKLFADHATTLFACVQMDKGSRG